MYYIAFRKYMIVRKTYVTLNKFSPHFVLTILNPPPPPTSELCSPLGVTQPPPHPPPTHPPPPTAAQFIAPQEMPVCYL